MYISEDKVTTFVMSMNMQRVGTMSNVSVFSGVTEFFMPLQKGLRLLHLLPQSNRQLEILKDVGGHLEPGRFTLLLGYFHTKSASIPSNSSKKQECI